MVLTEGELDALSVYQETGFPAVSLPNGARSFPPDLLEQLERKLRRHCEESNASANLLQKSETARCQFVVPFADRPLG